MSTTISQDRKEQLAVVAGGIVREALKEVFREAIDEANTGRTSPGSDGVLRATLKQAMREAMEESETAETSVRRGDDGGSSALPMLILAGAGLALAYALRQRNESLDEVVGNASERAQSMSEETAGRSSEAAQKTESVADKAADTIQETGESAADKIDEGGDRAADKIDESAQKADEKADEVGSDDE
ncbi:hypothetical protein G9464_01125 [Halostella sp. JP-L12]|uniref:hypothetical protein n=1 Tax=Halostella TaxID=1843185 RepID=UPI000EF78A53|nr:MULTISPECIES: hypothetical protein [Halostella]NHN46201.1 hypothetical protein [Halostella sp. JP-L12]